MKPKIHERAGFRAYQAKAQPAKIRRPKKSLVEKLGQDTGDCQRTEIPGTPITDKVKIKIAQERKGGKSKSTRKQRCLVTQRRTRGFGKQQLVSKRLVLWGT